MADEANDDLVTSLNATGNESLETSTIDNNKENEELVVLQSTNKELLKMIKLDIEEKILSKIKHSFDLTNKTKTHEIVFTNDFQVDKLGNTVRTGETSICEGWHVPKYENEYQNLIGLPHTEDDPSDTIKLKKPSQECFNCLATNHKITECPIKHDHERIQMHRKNFNSQSIAAYEQSQLFSNRYTNDSNELNRGFIPGKISDNLKDALGLSKGQLPPYIYIMRELGYPLGWLKEAQVRKSGLCIVDGKVLNETTESEIESGEEKEPENPEYDPGKLIDFEGFNQPVPEGFRDKQKSRSTSTQKIKTNESSLSISSTQDELKKLDDSNISITLQSETDENDKNTQILDESQNDKNKNDLEEHYGEIVSEISSTPIGANISGINKVPETDKFSGIGDFKPYEMLSNSTGQYQKIIKLAKELKQ